MLNQGLILPDDSSLPAIPEGYCSCGGPLWHLLTGGEDRGKRLFYTDETVGRGGELQTLIFVHGNPESSYLFRDTIGSLLDLKLPLTRVVSLDHIGFGLSSRATRLMSPLDHANNLSQLLARLSPERVTLVLHDWGGPIGLGAFLDHPERVRNILLLNTAIFPPSERFNYGNHPFPVLSWSTLASLVPDRLWGFFADRAIASRAGSRSELLFDLLRYPLKRRRGTPGGSPYRNQFSSAANVASSKYLALLARRWCEPNRPDEHGLNDFFCRLQEGVEEHWGRPEKKVRARLLCGEWDPLGDRDNARKWLRVLPQLEGEMTFFRGCGHFLPQVRPAEVAGAVYELLCG